MVFSVWFVPRSYQWEKYRVQFSAGYSPDSNDMRTEAEESAVWRAVTEK
jgi:hypothetical protein